MKKLELKSIEIKSFTTKNLDKIKGGGVSVIHFCVGTFELCYSELCTPDCSDCPAC